MNLASAQPPARLQRKADSDGRNRTARFGKRLKRSVSLNLARSANGDSSARHRPISHRTCCRSEILNSASTGVLTTLRIPQQVKKASAEKSCSD